MKKRLKKVLCIIILIVTLFNFTFTNNSYATDDSSGTTDSDTSVWNGIGMAVDGVTGILLMPAKVLLLTTGLVAKGIFSEIAEVGATKSESEWLMSLDDIFFHNIENKYPILNVNFFEKVNTKDDVINRIRNNIAGWYYAIRNLAIIISLLVLIYIGIRMAISTLAEDKARYKKMFTDWVVGFITIFLLHYIIVITIYTNEALVKVLSTGRASDNFSDYMTEIGVASLGTLTFTKGMAGAIIYCFMAALILVFLFAYIKRMLTVAFLIIIAPIITVTYSVDKIGDRKISSIKYLAEGICI